MLPNDIDFGVGVLHVGVLRARLNRSRRRVRRWSLFLITAVVLGLSWSPLEQQFRGRGTLALAGMPPDTALALDGRPVSEPVVHPLSGVHRLRFSRPGFYPVEMPITVTREQTATVSVPLLRPRPAVQPIPLPAPGASWHMAMAAAAGGWRLVVLNADVQPTPQTSARQTPRAVPQMTLLQFDGHELTRLSALEAYAAADELITEEGRFWAAWEPNRLGVRSDSGFLTISTPATSAVITTTTAISGLWWAPAGRWLLIAEARGIGQDLRLWSVQPPQSAPIVTIPGTVATVHWSPDGRAAVVLSQRPRAPESESPPSQDDSWEATLISRAAHAGVFQAVRLAAPPANPLGLVPMAWTPSALFWTAQLGQGLTLERIPLDAPLPARLGTLPPGMLALKVLDDQEIRILVNELHQGLTLQAWPTGQRIATLDDVEAAPAMGGMWLNNDLLLAAGQSNVWLLSFRPEALQ